MASYLQNTLLNKNYAVLGEISSESDSDYVKYWIYWFLKTRGHEFFVEIEDSFLLDRFNLTGLVPEVPQYHRALDLITEQYEPSDEEMDEEAKVRLDNSARHLYGLIHARYILTNRGLTQMMEKFKKAEFGECPRILCLNQAVLPVGLSDVCGEEPVQLYCPNCEDVYKPRSSRYQYIDGAFFGTSFPQMFFQVFPNLWPKKTMMRYKPKIFGFKVHEFSAFQDSPKQYEEEAEDNVHESVT